MEKTFINSKIPTTQYVWKKIGMIEQWKMLIDQPIGLNLVVYKPIGVDPITYYDRNYQRLGHPIQNSETVIKHLSEFIDLLKKSESAIIENKS